MLPILLLKPHGNDIQGVEESHFLEILALLICTFCSWYSFLTSRTLQNVTSYKMESILL